MLSSHSAVLRLQRIELTLQSLSPVLARYDPGVDVPLNCDIINQRCASCLTWCPGVQKIPEHKSLM